MEKLNEKTATAPENTAFLESNKSIGKHPLGTYAKSATPPSSKEYLLTTFEGLSTARKWGIKHAGATKQNLNKVRVTACMYVNYADVAVMRSIEHGSSHFKGLVTCGSVWACPVCARKIQERRRPEIEQAIIWAKSNGLTPIMVTLTFPHTRFDSLKTMLERQAEAFKRLRTGGPWRRFKEAVGYKYLIRSLEVTHGKNGWHPHTHELWFVDNPDQFMKMTSRLVELWASACRKVGLLSEDPKSIDAFKSHSVDVKIADDTVGEYLAKQDDSRKWSVSTEMAKASSKLGRQSGVHPHHFLIRRAKGDEELYCEYIEGMKGKRQIYWSRGLKDLVGINDVSDEELAEKQDDPSVLLGLLTPEDWSLIRKADVRAEVLIEAEKGGWIAVVNLLESLKKQKDDDDDELDEDLKYLLGLID